MNIINLYWRAGESRIYYILQYCNELLRQAKPTHILLFNLFIIFQLQTRKSLAS